LGTDPELHGLKELHDALMARRKAIAIEVGERRQSFRDRGNFQPTDEWEKARELVETQNLAADVAAIIRSLTVVP
jgi:hypothetical protein